MLWREGASIQRSKAADIDATSPSLGGVPPPGDSRLAVTHGFGLPLNPVGCSRVVRTPAGATPVARQAGRAAPAGRMEEAGGSRAPARPAEGDRDGPREQRVRADHEVRRRPGVERLANERQSKRDETHEAERRIANVRRK